MKACGDGVKCGGAARAAFALVVLTLALTSNPSGAATETVSSMATISTGLDLNQATRAEIEAVRGVGVELTDRLLAARERGPFQDWGEARKRVKGLGKRALMGFAEAGFHIRNQPPPSP
jgi:competence protein ComEA